MSDTKEYWNELIALITYLGCTEFNSRRFKPMADDLGLSHDRVEKTLKRNPAFFRKSRNTKPGTKEHYWTLQLRYTLRPFKEDDSEATGRPLEPMELQPLLNLLSALRSQGHEQELAINEIGMQAKELRIAAIIAIVSAIHSGWCSHLCRFIKVMKPPNKTVNHLPLEEEGQVLTGCPRTNYYS